MPRITRHDAEKLLGQVPEANAFWCCDARTLKSMPELGEALNSMTDEAFDYHSKQQKNDFSKWVGDVVGDQKLARDLAGSSSRTQAAKRVQERIAFLGARLTGA